MPPSLQRTTATGFLWLLFQGLSGRLASFVSQIVLARLLMPEAFGQIGLAYTVGALVTAVVSFGIDDVLLTRARQLRLWVAPALWSSMGLALAGMAVMLAAGPVAARLYGAPGLTGLVAVLAINLPLGAAATVPTVRLRSELNFRFLGAYASAETVAIQAATILCAAAGLGAYSFVLPLPVAAAIKAVVFWRRAPVAIRPGHRRAQYRHLVGSGLLVLSTRLMIALVNQGDYMVLGLLASQRVVGVYFFAFRLAAQPVQMLAGSFGGVLFPAFSQLNAAPARQMEAALRASRVLAYAITPVCFLQAAEAAPLLHLMFGARWDGAVPLVQILSLGLPGDALAWVAGALLIARGEFRRDVRLVAVFTPPFFVCVLLGVWLGGATGVAIGVSLFYALIKPLNSWLVFRQAMTLRDVLAIYVLPPVLGLATIGAASALAALPVLAGRSTAQVGVIGVLGPVFYVAALRLVAPATLAEIVGYLPLGRLRQLMGRRKASA